MRILFAAQEPGAAAWMAPVWQRMPGASHAALTPLARTHLERCGTPLPAKTSELTSDIAARIVEDKPSAVMLSATGAAVEHNVIAACRDASVPVTQIVDTWAGYERRFGRLAPDTIAVIDAQAEDECRAAGAPPATYVHTGHPAWERVEALPPADPRDVLVVGQPIAAVYGGTLGYDERVVAEMVDRIAGKRPDLIASVSYLAHPSEDRPPASGVTREPSLAVRHAGTVIGMFSSLLVDAILSGRRVVVVQPGDGPDHFGPSRHGHIARCRSAQDVERALEALHDGNSAATLRAIVAGSADRVLAHLGIGT